MTWDEAYASMKCLQTGTTIPKPKSKHKYEIRHWLHVDGEERLAYSIARKSIPISWIRVSFERITETGELRTEWFRRSFYGGKDLGGCNFTTVGGLFCLIGIAEYSKPGLYVKPPKEARS